MTSSPASPSRPDAARQGSWLVKPSLLQVLYLALAGAGAILPWLANLDYIRASGGSFDIATFIAQANANPAASSLSRDLGIGATAFVVWMISEARRLRMRGLPWVLLCCVTVAFACAAPLFLYLRERRLVELDRQPDPGEPPCQTTAHG
ncbi:MAG: DUF2834 domain-containing protein [Cyanobacteriota bacterium]|nr:DUF2834 domain-containing protein [Cyanobacteriota bacterium]